MDLQPTFEALGPRLRQLRQTRNVTLTELAEETGISASTLSRLESGLRQPTLEQLLPLARAYNITLDDLVDAPTTGDPRTHLRPISVDDTRVVIPLTRRAGRTQAYKFVLRAGTKTDEPEPRTHEGYEWVYVLNGRLRLILGEHDLLLEPGEAAEFDTHTPTGSAPPPQAPSSSSASSTPRREGTHPSLPATGRPRGGVVSDWLSARPQPSSACR